MKQQYPLPTWKPDRKSLASVGTLAAAALLACVPLLVRGPSCGHDFDFHLASWLDALQSWREGIFYPHWATSPNFGAGEPRFIFYPPLTWMLGAALGAVTNWQHVPFLITFLLLAASGFATRALARQVMPLGPATLAGCLAIFSGYALYTAYERTAYAELTGGFWIPLMLLFLWRERSGSEESLLRRAWDGSAALLALIFAGAWLSNAPLGVMASYLLAAFGLAIALLARSWVPVIRAATAGILGLGLAAFYIVPAALEQHWVDIRQATDDPGLLIENSFLFARHANPLLEQHDAELLRVSFIAITIIVITIAAFLVCWIRHLLPGRRVWWLPLAMLPFVILLLQFPISLPVWNFLPKLRFLQFPWRWMVAMGAPLGVFVAAAAWMDTRRARVAVCTCFALFFAGITFLTGRFLFESCYPEDTVSGMLQTYRDGSGVEGTDEYAPPGADNSLVAMGLPGACFTADPQISLGAGDPNATPEWSPDQHTCAAVFPFVVDEESTWEHKLIRASLPRSGYLVLRLRSYPAWRMSVNGKQIQSTPARQDGLMAVPVPAGPVTLQADWITTTDVKDGRWITLLSLVLVTFLGVYERRGRSRPQLS